MACGPPTVPEVGSTGVRYDSGCYFPPFASSREAVTRSWKLPLIFAPHVVVLLSRLTESRC